MLQQSSLLLNTWQSVGEEELGAGGGGASHLLFWYISTRARHTRPNAHTLLTGNEHVAV